MVWSRDVNSSPSIHMFFFPPLPFTLRPGDPDGIRFPGSSSGKIVEITTQSSTLTVHHIVDVHFFFPGIAASSRHDTLTVFSYCVAVAVRHHDKPSLFNFSVHFSGAKCSHSADAFKIHCANMPSAVKLQVRIGYMGEEDHRTIIEKPVMETGRTFGKRAKMPPCRSSTGLPTILIINTGHPAMWENPRSRGG
ncbi:hypothetical protein LY78DRAFT_347766 [Colletotrichum sublineola]|nr:hypothetical protein LY78DRAFT_347766 [Colletotrichum sublineola]